MYVRIQYPKIQCLDDNGQLAAGYEIHTFAAGTSTPATTYSDRALSVANTNPVILDARGEADIYVGAAVKLVFTIPDGDTASPIWEVDYVAEQQSNFVTGSATPVTLNNNYVVSTTPAVSALINNFMLIMTPDVDNSDTTVSNVFTGTGINDMTVSGVYIGSTSGSVFTFEIDGKVEDVPTAPTAALSATAGSVTTGNHIVVITFVTAQGETTAGAVSATVTADGSHKIALTNIPVGTSQVTDRKVYMTEAGGSDYYLVATIADNTTTAYDIDITDAALAANDPIPTTNTTGGTGGVDTFKWKKDGGAWTSGVDITGTAQAILEGLSITFAVTVGHTLNDLWAVTVITPVRVNLDSLGNLLVYKNKGGNIVGLDGGDMKAGYPAQLILNEALNAWLLINPATPIFTTTTIQAVRYRKNIYADYSMVAADEGYELSCVGAFTITLLTCPEFSGKFFYIKNAGSGIVTVDGGSYVIKGSGSPTYSLGVGESIQLVTNGVDWHIIADVKIQTPPMPPPLTWVSASVVKVAASAECPTTVQLAGMPNVNHVGAFINSSGSSSQITSDATGAFIGTEKVSQWYAAFAVSQSDGTFTVELMPWMRVKSQASQTISLGTLTTPATGIGYGFTTDELIGATIYFISGASNGMIRTITANNNDNTTGGTITYSGTALTVTAGDWFIVLPNTNFRLIAEIFNNSSGNIRQFKQLGNKFFFNPGFHINPAYRAVKEDITICSPMADQIQMAFKFTLANYDPCVCAVRNANDDFEIAIAASNGSSLIYEFNGPSFFPVAAPCGILIQEWGSSYNISVVDIYGSGYSVPHL